MTRQEIKLVGLGGFGWLFALGIVFLISYDQEIRCALGNKQACDKLEYKASKNATH